MSPDPQPQSFRQSWQAPTPAGAAAGASTAARRSSGSARAARCRARRNTRWRSSTDRMPMTSPPVRQRQSTVAVAGHQAVEEVVLRADVEPIVERAGCRSAAPPRRRSHTGSPSATRSATTRPSCRRNVDAIGGERGRGVRGATEIAAPDQRAVARAEREDLAGVVATNQPAVVPHRRARRAVPRTAAATRPAVRPRAAPSACRLDARTAGRRPRPVRHRAARAVTSHCCVAGRQVVRDDAIAFDREVTPRVRVVGGRSDRAVVERERPELPAAGKSDSGARSAAVSARLDVRFDLGGRACAESANGEHDRGQVHYNILWFGDRPHRYNSVNPSGPFRDPSNHHRSRFRLAVHPAHRAAAARAVGLLRDLAARHADREDPRAASRSASSCRADRRASRMPARRMRSRQSSTSAVRCSASATACS